MPSLIETCRSALGAAIKTKSLRIMAVGLALALSACAQQPIVADPGPAPAPATTPDRTTVVAINFDFDSHRIRPEAYAVLDALAAALSNQRLAGYRFDIDGHTDIIGRLSYNIALSMLRAQTVLDYLALRGVPREAMRAQGFGPLRPYDPSNPAAAVNRRVEVTSIR